MCINTAQQKVPQANVKVEEQVAHYVAQRLTRQHLDKSVNRKCWKLLQSRWNAATKRFKPPGQRLQFATHD